MSLVVDQQQSNNAFKHYCKICQKGFVDGRALGGHMRAHGILGDESDHHHNIDDEDPASDLEDKLGGACSGGGGGGGGNVPPPVNKRMYTLRTNPNRLKSCRACANCGKEFLSWKSFLEHGKCSYDDAESLVSSPGSEDEDGAMARAVCGWSKRKRSFRAQVDNNCPSSEEEDLANCLMMLSNATVDPFVAEPEESCASASKEEERRIRPSSNFVNTTITTPVIGSYKVPTIDKGKSVVAPPKGMFECKACKKVFNSHQALGGHRASHKKVKGCFAAKLDQVIVDDTSLLADIDQDVITNEEFFPAKQTTNTLQFDHGNDNNPLASTSKKKKVHQCSICHRVFSSGQALGGHKRCHWITSNSVTDTSAASLAANFHQFHEHIEQIHQRSKFIDNSEPLDLALDLNLPAPADDPRQDRKNPSSFDISTKFYLRSWVGAIDSKEKDDNDHHHHYRHHHHQSDHQPNIVNNNNNYFNGSTQNKNNNVVVDDDAESKVKLAKLSELKDMNMSGGSSSPWLQVGIGSTTDVRADA